MELKAGVCSTLPSQKTSSKPTVPRYSLRFRKRFRDLARRDSLISSSSFPRSPSSTASFGKCPIYARWHKQLPLLQHILSLPPLLDRCQLGPEYHQRGEAELLWSLILLPLYHDRDVSTTRHLSRTGSCGLSVDETLETFSQMTLGCHR